MLYQIWFVILYHFAFNKTTLKHIGLKCFQRYILLSIAVFYISSFPPCKPLGDLLHLLMCHSHIASLNMSMLLLCKSTIHLGSYPLLSVSFLPWVCTMVLKLLPYVHPQFIDDFWSLGNCQLIHETHECISHQPYSSN